MLDLNGVGHVFQVLEEVCTKHGFNAMEYDLRWGNIYTFCILIISITFTSSFTTVVSTNQIFWQA